MRKVGIGTRVMNFLVDTTIIFIITYIVYKIWNFNVFYYHIPYYPFYYFMALILFLYYLVFESINGRTVGKLLTISRVANAAGGKPSFFQILIRSLIRITVIDCFFIPFLNMPLHDFLSKTYVVDYEKKAPSK
ncbi:MAG: RDD family protein [Bacteroidetes bacterium]|nr:RDD family protein [Bacteroidota bacterium]